MRQEGRLMRILPSEYQQHTLAELTLAECPFYDVVRFAIDMRGLVEEWQRRVITILDGYRKIPCQR
jgi:spore cortex formation protein SpoVR/YcgB (stage V sporulation)